MKCGPWFFAALLWGLFLLLMPAGMADEAGQERLHITEAAYDPASGRLTVVWINTGDESVYAAVWAGRILILNTKQRIDLLSDGQIQ